MIREYISELTLIKEGSDQDIVYVWIFIFMKLRVSFIIYSVEYKAILVLRIWKFSTLRTVTS